MKLGCLLVTLVAASALALPAVAVSADVSVDQQATVSLPLPPAAAPIEGEYGASTSGLVARNPVDPDRAPIVEHRKGAFQLGRGPIGLAVLLPWKDEYALGHQRVVLDPAHPLSAVLNGQAGIAITADGNRPTHLELAEDGIAVHTPGDATVLLPWAAVPTLTPVVVDAGPLTGPADHHVQGSGSLLGALLRVGLDTAASQACSRAPLCDGQPNGLVDQFGEGDSCTSGDGHSPKAIFEHMNADSNTWTDCARWSTVEKVACEHWPGGEAGLGNVRLGLGNCSPQTWQHTDDHMIPTNDVVDPVEATWDAAWISAASGRSAANTIPTTIDVSPPLGRTEVAVDAPLGAPPPLPVADPQVAPLDGFSGLSTVAVGVRAERVAIDVLGTIPAAESVPSDNKAAPGWVQGGAGAGSVASGPSALLEPRSVAGGWLGRVDPLIVRPLALPGLASASLDAAFAPTVAPGLGAVGAALLAVALLVPLWLLYHRLRPDEALLQDQRKRIYDAIEAQPGLAVGDLRKLTGLHYTTCRHHVRTLRVMGLVVAKNVHGGVRCFPNHGRYGELETRLLAASRSPTAGALLRLARERPGIGGLEAAAALGIAPGTVTYHAKRLEALGLLDASRSGRRVRLSLAPQAAVLAARAFAQSLTVEAGALRDSATHAATF